MTKTFGALGWTQLLDARILGLRIPGIIDDQPDARRIRNPEMGWALGVHLVHVIYLLLK
jgi:hypothetical protein